jgi:streptomycin 6-kinase
MTKLTCTLTQSDDNYLILETRGQRGQQTQRVIPRDDNAATALLSAVDAAFEANKPPQRPQPAPAATAPVPEKTETPA